MTREQAVPLTPSEETQQPRTTCGFCGHESHKRWCGDCSDGPCRRATQADYDVAADYDRPATAGRHRTQEQAAPLTEAGRTLITKTYGGKERTREDFEALRDAILAIEAEAYKAGRDGLDVALPIMPEDLWQRMADRLYVGGLIERDDREDARAVLAAEYTALTPSDTPKDPTP